ncbi:MAG: cell division FtsZ family protein [Deltaproteobacteria bacterium]|jgi:cell division protein FtsZ|nr:cell division FtsZ family protein [Deltaproteobacteria bacterium]
MDTDNYTPESPDSLLSPGCELEFIDDELMVHHKIMVMGLGGCGNNAINHMVRSGLKGPVFIAANSDLQALNPCLAKIKIQLGVKLSAGHGCGGDPELGRLCARENLDDVLKPLKGCDMAFLMAGLGGGTGSGAIPVVAEALARLENPPLVVGVVTTPFPWEDDREPLSYQIIRELLVFCNSVIIIPNAQICELFQDLPFLQAKSKVDDVLLRAVSSITNLIEKAGVINLDFADVCKVMTKKGAAIMGYGEGVGEKRALQALESAISNPLLLNASLKGAKGVLVNVTSDAHIRTSEVNLINQKVREAIGEGVELFSGLVVDEELADSKKLIVTVVATGLDLGEELSELSPELSSELDELGALEVDPELSEDLLSDEAEPNLVVLGPALEANPPSRQFRADKVGSGPLAPVPMTPVPLASAVQSATEEANSRTVAAKRPLPLSPMEIRSGATPLPLNPLGQRARPTKYEKYGVNQGVDPAFTEERFYDFPPRQRSKDK